MQETFQPDQSIPPSYTLYINNLNQSIKPNKLKQSLQTVFSVYGKIIDVHVRKSLDMRGQAFISFDSIESSTTAMNALQNGMLFDRPMHIQFSKNESDKVCLFLGKEIEREKLSKEQRLERKELKLKEKEMKQKEIENNIDIFEMKSEDEEKENIELFDKSYLEKRIDLSENNENSSNNKIKYNQNEENSEKENEITNEIKEQPKQLSKRLFLKNIPSSIGKKELEDIVSHENGFIEVRYINIKGQAVAFIEFETIQQAEYVYNSSLFDSIPLDISFAID